MSATSSHELCLRLLEAETDAEVKGLLVNAGFWSDNRNWRPVGDNEQNRAVVGNQQEDAVSALAEKLTNSIDAVLIDRCLQAGIDPKSPEAPRSMREAITRFFPVSDTHEPQQGGLLWAEDRLTKTELDALAGHVWVSVTGSKKSPSLTIADRGEGQTPDSFPKTFMALLGYQTSDGRTESQKRDIPFVQGQFNMGSSGVYPNASRENGFQFLVSRRNPALLGPRSTARDLEWGFTVVRRRKSSTGSVFEYLAPVDAGDMFGNVLSFPAEALPLLPESPPKSVPNLAFAGEVEYGTLVKLYEYQYRATGISYSHVLQKNGLLRQLDLAVPECQLPIRVVEARAGYKGEPGSFQTNLMGALYRFHTAYARDVSRASAKGFESGEESEGLRFEGAPVHGEITLRGVVIPWQAFVFRENAEDQTRSGSCALIYQINGQKHAHQSTDFFRRKEVGLRYLAQRNTIFMVVDCTNLSNLDREDVFKPSRDRLRDSELTRELVGLLMESIKASEALSELEHQQHGRVQKSRLADKAPVRNILEQLIKSTPSLARFFRLGPDVRTSKPFKDAEAGEGAGGGTFVGVRSPTFLHLKNGETTRRQEAHIGSRSRIQFTTDAENGYFSRGSDVGTLSVRFTNSLDMVSGSRGELRDGAFTFTIHIPESAVEGTALTVEFQLLDLSMDAPLTCRVELDIHAPTASKKHGSGGSRSTSTQKGGLTGGQVTLNDLDIQKCCKEDPPREGCDASWPSDWNEHTGIQIMENPGGGLTYMINVSNVHLLEHQKQNPTKDPLLLESKFMWALLLLAIAIVADYQKEEEAQSVRDDTVSAIEEANSFGTRRDDDVMRVTRAAAQTVFPIIDTVGAWTADLLDSE